MESDMQCVVQRAVDEALHKAQRQWYVRTVLYCVVVLCSVTLSGVVLCAVLSAVWRGVVLFCVVVVWCNA